MSPGTIPLGEYDVVLFPPEVFERLPDEIVENVGAVVATLPAAEPAGSDPTIRGKPNWKSTMTGIDVSGAEHRPVLADWNGTFL
jgi:hypothetical protein